MPIKVETTSALGQRYDSPVINLPEGAVQLKLDISGLSGTSYVDSAGVLKPGTFFKEAAGVLTPLTNNAVDQTETAAYFNPWPIKLLKLDVGDVLATELTNGTDRDITVYSRAEVNRDALEDQLGRAISTSEVAAIGRNNNFRLI